MNVADRLLALVLIGVTGAVAQRVPLATEADKALSPLLISRDGSEVTFRGAALNTLRICVEPESGKFGRRVCFTVGDVRTAVVAKR